jgi:release factor glutamine methyltransferase
VTVAELVATATAALRGAGVSTARNDAEWLLAGVLDGGRFDAYLLGDRAVPAGVAARYDALVRRRAAGEPLQQILGWEAFRGLRIRVTPDVLVPRPETELLVEWALELLGPDARLVVDVGTGSGCIACAVALERPGVRVLALDLSAAASTVAAENAAALGARDRIDVVVGDLLASVRAASADLIVANPPYLPAPILASLQREVRDWEPHLALLGGDDGLSVLRLLVADARRVLTPGAALVLETAGADQAETVAALMRASGYTAVETRADLTGIERLVAGRRVAGRGHAGQSAVSGRRRWAVV